MVLLPGERITPRQPSWPSMLMSLSILLQLLHEFVNAVHLFRNLDALRTMFNTLAAANAVGCLAQARHAAVVAY